MLQPLVRTLRDSARDLAPIILVIAAFQVLVLRQPIPDFLDLLVGSACVVIGLALFVRGLEAGLFPLGSMLADGLAARRVFLGSWCSHSASGSARRSPSPPSSR